MSRGSAPARMSRVIPGIVESPTGEEERQGPAPHAHLPHSERSKGWTVNRPQEDQRAHRGASTGMVSAAPLGTKNVTMVSVVVSPVLRAM